MNKALEKHKLSVLELVSTKAFRKADDKCPLESWTDAEWDKTCKEASNELNG